MKSILASLLMLSLSACAIAPVGGGNAGGGGHTGGGKAGGDTVLVCHKGKKTMELPRSAAEAHLNHGDKPGPC